MDYTVARRHAKNGDGEPLLGECDFELKRISVEPKIDKQIASEVFVHESLHALFNECHFEMDASKEEEIINATCAFLFKHFKLSLKSTR